MFRKALIFLLFCLASPAWLVMRSRYGTRFLRYLFIAWAVMAGAAYAIRQAAFNPESFPEGISLLAAWAVGAAVIYPLSGLLWPVQFVLILLHRLAIRTGDSAPPHPWYTGALPLLPGTPRIIDHAVVMAAGLGAWVFFFGPNGALDRGISLTMIPMMAAFWLLAHSLRWNENTLPYRLPSAPAPKQEKPVTTRIVSKSRPQDGLAEIFSRRDPALNHMTQTR